MAERREVYVCDECDNVVEVLRGGQGQLVCCGQPMQRLDEQTADTSTEKHVPVVESTASGYKVTVGSTIHPMEEAHYIEWIELIADGRTYRKYLEPGDEPIVEFEIDADEVSAREHCNVHGLWRG